MRKLMTPGIAMLALLFLITAGFVQTAQASAIGTSVNLPRARGSASARCLPMSKCMPKGRPILAFASPSFATTSKSIKAQVIRQPPLPSAPTAHCSRSTSLATSRSAPATPAPRYHRSCYRYARMLMPRNTAFMQIPLTNVG
jgi:hypothetical protein